jgi:hypothetical protein
MPWIRSRRRLPLNLALTPCSSPSEVRAFILNKGWLEAPKDGDVLDWWEQGRDADGNRTWKRHPIDPFHSEYHDLMWRDIDGDGDGQNELITGTRYQAHPNDEDPGGHEIWESTTSSGPEKGSPNK